MCYRWAAFRTVIEDVNKAVKDMMDGDNNVNVRLHIGAANYVCVKSGFRCVDFRTFYRPYDAKASEIKPSRKGVALRLDEWENLCSIIDIIHATYPSLQSAQPCYAGDDHMNQIGWLECAECHPWINQFREPTSMPGEATAAAMASGILE